MTQQEVYNLLKKNKWMTTKEIKNSIGINQGSVSSNLRALNKLKEVERKKVKGKKNWNYIWRKR